MWCGGKEGVEEREREREREGKGGGERRREEEGGGGEESESEGRCNMAPLSNGFSVEISAILYRP